MKLEKIRIENEQGETADVLRAEYIKNIIKEHEVKTFVSEETGETDPKSLVLHIIKSLEDGSDVNEEIAGEYSDLIKVIEADVKRTIDSKADKKKEAEEAKAKKAEEKAKREADEAKAKEELALKQQEFALKVAAGKDAALAEFAEEVDQLIKSLPDGATLVQSGTGYGLSFAEGATQETIGQTLGYMLQKADNSSFIGNQLHFWVGDTISVAVERKIYDTAKQAAAHISKVLSETSGKAIEAPSLDQYKRMAERTPVEYRNPKADPTAYLALSSMKAPKKEEKESQESFDKRSKAFESDREAVQQKLAVGELSKRKEVMPIVNELLIKHGMREAVDPNAPVISIGQQLQIFFHTTFALENLLSVHKEDMVVYKTGAIKVDVSKEELEAQRDSAMANLTNALYTNAKLDIKPADYVRGYVMTKAKVEVAKDANGKAIMEEQNVKNFVFPLPFFEVEDKKEETPAETPAAETPATEEPAKGKKGKK